MASFGPEGEEDDEARGGMFGGGSSSTTRRSNTPVLDALSLNLNKAISEDPIEYLPRDKELTQFARFLLKKEKHHTFIIGQPGTGRQSFIKSAVQYVQREKTTPELNSLSFRLLDFHDLVAGTKYRGTLEDRFRAIIAETELSRGIILYFPSIANFLAESDTWNYGAALQMLILSSNVRLVSILTDDEFHAFQKKFKALNRYINLIKFSPPSREETILIVKTHLARFETEYNCLVSDEAVKTVVELSDSYMPDEFQPAKSIQVLEETCITKKLKLTDYIDEDSEYLQCLARQSTLEKEIAEIAIEKNRIVKLQKYEEAAQLRDREKKIEREYQKVIDDTEKAISLIRLDISSAEIIHTLSEIVGISPEKINAGVDVPSRNETIASRISLSGPPRFEVSQTQSILFGDEILIKKGTAFVLLPHNSEFDQIYEAIIRPSMEANGLVPLKADNIYQPGNILSQVWQEIRSAEVIVADVSGHNPNVIFELGLCYGIQRCPIILTRDPEELPFNLRNLRYIHYNNDSIGGQNLKNKLTSTVKEFLSAVRVPA